MPQLIDIRYLGLDRIIGAWVVDDVIVDPGPESGLEALLEGLDVEPRALLLTHIHLDHAGAAGALVKRFPDLRVYVHEVGAPHMLDPSRLLRSVARLYDDLEGIYGRTLPVPEENLTALRGDERIEGFKTAYTPGHAGHHVSYLHEATGDAFVGDVAGVRIHPAEFTVAPTPPPDIDLAAWEASLDVLRDWRPNSLRLTHFGAVDEAQEQIDATREALRRQAETARGGERDSFMAGLEAAARDATDAETAERYIKASPPEHVWLGLERYWSRQG